jgi:hypothetical protein
MASLLHWLKRDQRGQAALTLAVVGIMFTTMLVIPFLVQVQTSLLAVRSAGQGLSGATCAQAAVEFGLWKLKYDQAFVDSLEIGVPTPYQYLCEGGGTAPGEIILRYVPASVPAYLSEYAYADIVLVTDVSSSINTEEMSAFKQAAHAIVDGFNLDENGERYRVGLSRFGKFSEPVVDVTDQSAPLHTAIDGYTSTSIFSCFSNPDQIACGTNIVAGLNGGVAQYATGLGDRPEIPNLMVFLTDGDDNAGNTTTDIANASAASGARIFAVGIAEVSSATLDAIASEPDPDHVFYADDFQALIDLIEDIVAAVTQAGLAGTLYDIEVTGPDGTTIRVRVLLTVDGNIVVVSSQEV